MATAIDRQSILGAASILDSLDIGWRPGKAELDDARYLDNWALIPPAETGIFRLIGRVWSLPVQSENILAAVLAIDPSATWVRTWNEWLVIGDALHGVPSYGAGEVQAAANRWLKAELRRFSYC